VLELVSYGNTLVEFRKALEAMPTDAAPSSFVQAASDVWNMILATVRRMLGVPQSVASDVIMDSFKLLSEASGAKFAKTRKGGKLDAAESTQGQTLPDTIEVDGKQRPTKNSDGRPIASTPEKVRSFWRWFGDSKIVDAQGRPVVVYHGTKSDFDTFDLDNLAKSSMDYGWFGAGFYTSEVPSLASDYAGRRTGSAVMPLYIRAKNPLEAKRQLLVPEMAASRREKKLQALNIFKRTIVNALMLARSTSVGRE